MTDGSNCVESLDRNTEVTGNPLKAASVLPGSQSPYSPLYLRNAFGASFTIGVIALITKQLLPEYSGAVHFLTWVPFLTIALYAYFGMRTKGWHYDLERWADGAYYLGFLFTMTALVASFWGFRSGSQSDLTIRLVLDLFGVALTTTLAGLAVRTFAYQLAPNPVAALQGSELELSDLAMQLSKQLHVALDLFKTETDKRLGGQVDSAKAAIAAIQETANAATKEMGNSAKIFQDEIATYGKIVKASSGKIAAAAEKSADVANAVALGAATVASAAEQLNRSLAAAITETTAKTHEVSSALEKAGTTAADELATAVSGLTIELKGQMAQMETAIQTTAGSLQVATRLMSEVIRELQLGLKDAVAHSTTEISAIAGVIQATSSNTERLTAAMSEVLLQVQQTQINLDKFTNAVSQASQNGENISTAFEANAIRVSERFAESTKNFAERLERAVSSVGQGDGN